MENTDAFSWTRKCRQVALYLNSQSSYNTFTYRCRIYLTCYDYQKCETNRWNCLFINWWKKSNISSFLYGVKFLPALSGQQLLQDKFLACCVARPFRCITWLSISYTLGHMPTFYCFKKGPLQRQLTKIKKLRKFR